MTTNQEPGRNGHDPGAAFDPATLDMLGRPLLPELIASRPADDNDEDGKQLQYVPSHIIISQANRVLGYGQWSFTHDAPEPVYNNGDPPRLLGYSCKGRLRVGAAVYENVGMTSIKSAAMHAATHTFGDLEMAYKGAVSDAMTRCFRNLGQQFGNALYEKTDERLRVFNRVKAISPSLEVKMRAGYGKAEDVPLARILVVLDEYLRKRQQETAAAATDQPTADPAAG